MQDIDPFLCLASVVNEEGDLAVQTILRDFAV